MNWYEATERYHEQTFSHDCQLSSLPNQWQREMAALWRLEADVNNGAYLQCLSNWGRETYEYASQALKRIGARKMAKIIDACQILVDEHFDAEGKTQNELRELTPNTVVGGNGNVIKERGSVLPQPVIDRIYTLSYQFMEYPEDIAELGTRHYSSHVDAAESGRTKG